MGDFNFKEITWQHDLDYNLPTHCLQFLDLINRFGWEQLNTHPSRHGNDNILDLILTNFPHKLSQIYANTYTYTSDHFLLDFTIKCTVDKLTNPPKTLYNFKKADTESLTSELPQLTDITEQQHDSIDDLWTTWSTSLLNIITTNVPTITLKNPNSPPWEIGRAHV